MSKKNQCERCDGQCCRYFALPLDTPEDRDDHDDIRWYLCHKDVTVFVEEGDWYVNVKNACRHLSRKDHTCKIYDHRPKICRGYSHDECDFVEGDYEYDLHFTTDKQMEEYIKVKFDNPIKPKQAVKKGASKAS
jgi:Fe-S-cluster containining protein